MAGHASACPALSIDRQPPSAAGAGTAAGADHPESGLRLRKLGMEYSQLPDNQVRLGSVTKQFTVVSVLLLAERGKWKLSDRVKQYMPDAPAAWDRITIHQLLTHTSGIPNFTSFSEYRDTEVEATTPEQLVKRFRDKPLDSDPGTKWSYSNSGYVLLGYLLEKVSEETYQKFRRISSRRSICRISVTTRTQPSFCIARPDTRLRKTELSTADILT